MLNNTTTTTETETMTKTNETTGSATVRFLAQGGNWQGGTATGRIGKSQVLVSYRIQDGSPRERFIPRGRVEIDDATLATLPAWKRQQCKAITLDEPILVERDEHGARTDDGSRCPQCGNVEHRAAQFAERLVGGDELQPIGTEDSRVRAALDPKYQERERAALSSDKAWRAVYEERKAEEVALTRPVEALVVGFARHSNIVPA